MSLFIKFQCTVSGVSGAFLEAVLDSVTRPVAGAPGSWPGLLLHRPSMEETNALVPVPKQNPATHNHAQVRRVVQICRLVLLSKANFNFYHHCCRRSIRWFSILFSIGLNIRGFYWYLFWCDDSIKVCLKIGLNGFFGQVFTLET